MNPLSQYACPPRVLNWARNNVVEVRHAESWAKNLQLPSGERDIFMVAILIQALYAAHQRAYVSELNKPILVWAPNPWISIHDRVPEEGKSWVLCVDGSEGGGAMCTMAWWKQPDGSYRWTHLNACEHPNLHPEDVTHWMPLPEAPKAPDESSRLSYGIRENEIVSNGSTL